jgi:ABC-type lipoprotein release transport system permease subunit
MMIVAELIVLFHLALLALLGVVGFLVLLPTSFLKHLPLGTTLADLPPGEKKFAISVFIFLLSSPLWMAGCIFAVFPGVFYSFTFLVSYYRIVLFSVLGFYLLLFVTLPLLGKVPISYSVRNLLVRWKITLMTMAAFTLIAALLTVMLAFVNGMYRLTANSAHAGNVMVLSDGAPDEAFSNLIYSDVGNLENLPGVVKEDSKSLASWEVYVVVNQKINRPPVDESVLAAARLREKWGCILLIVGGIVAFLRLLIFLARSGVLPLGDTLERLIARNQGILFGVGAGVLLVAALNLFVGVVLLWPMLTGTAPQAEHRTRRFVQVRGILDPETSGKVHTLPLYPGGEWFDPAVGVTEKDGKNLHQAVLGEGIARELGKDAKKPTLEVGDTFEMADWDWVVTGIMQSAGSTFDSEIWAKRELVKDKFHKDNYTTCVLRAENEDSARELTAFVSEKFSDTKVNAQMESDYYDKLNGTNRVFLIGSLVVTGVMAFGGIFGVMNTMFAAISQRIKDIGVLRIIGFTGWQVLLSFFLESLLLALAGGLLGCALGCLAHGWSATSIAGSGQGGGKTVVLKITVDATILAAGLAFTLIMGTVGGIIPALFAMRVRPLESLR